MNFQQDSYIPLNGALCLTRSCEADTFDVINVRHYYIVSNRGFKRADRDHLKKITLAIIYQQ